jgi:Tol biopolymer transport system component
MQVGTKIGAYEVIAKLGEGGMGEVYRGRDAKLGRDVALKVVPAAFASDPERVARFEREARTLAALNHPNIAQIYGLQEASADGTGVTALVMELVDGEDLARQIARGPVSLDDALPIARQIADALDAAHEQGIIHRDLKPANINVRPDGTVKVLDFGLAKGVAESEAAAAADSGKADSPTVAPPAMTSPGVLLGTAAYMSPEQARGRSVDRRADVWAFGCVLFEMLTGRAAFDAESVPEILSAILSREPDWSALPPGTPPSVRRLLRRCLVRDPRHRLRSLGDALLELETDSTMEATVAPHAPLQASPAGRLAWLAAGAALGAGALFVWTSTRSAVPDGVANVRLERVTDAIGHEESPAVSPDGKTIAWVARVNGRQQIWVRLLAGGAALQLTKADTDHTHPRWTPDSSAIVYFTTGASPRDPGTLWEIPALGGTARPVMSASSGGDVSHDGGRVAAIQLREGKYVLAIASRDGSAIRHIIELTAGLAYTHLRWSPDDRWVVYQQSDSVQFDKRINIVSSSGGEIRTVVRSDDLRGVSWLADGSGLVYSSAQGSTVLYPPTFNLRVVATDGSRDRQITFGDVSYIEPDVRGTSVAASRLTSQSDIWKIPVTGTADRNVLDAVRITRQTGVAQVPSVSPDEQQAVFLSDSGGHGNLWVAATDGSGARQITFEHDPQVSIGVPAWSPVDSTIAFIMTREGLLFQWLIQADGRGLRRLVEGVWAYWSPDGKWLYHTRQRDTVFNIDKVAVDGGPSVSVRRDDAAAPAVSPDGTLYFVSPARGASGTWEWALRKARPETAEPRTLTTMSGARIPTEDLNIHPIVSPDGRWLAQPLIDGGTTNLWLVNTQDGTLRRVTDFADRPVVIARRVSWSRDSRHIYAAVAETDADVVLLRNVLER